MKEQISIRHKKCILTETPCYSTVSVSGLNQEWEEVKGDIKKISQYKVDYEMGTLQFHKKLEGKEVSVEYECRDYESMMPDWNVFSQSSSIFKMINGEFINGHTKDSEWISFISEMNEKKITPSEIKSLLSLFKKYSKE